MMMEDIIVTAIHYPDIVGWSPNKTFRCEARSPYNLPEWHPDRKVSPTEALWPDAFQEDFEFALYEGDSDRPLWVVPQSDVAEASPHEIYVSDRGTIVVRTHGPFSASLVVLGAGGARTLTVDLLDEVFVDAWERHVSHTSAGPFWSAGSHAYFPILEEREHFCVRMWWGGRILLDLGRRQRVDETASRALLAKFESAWVLGALRSGADTVASWEAWPARDATTEEERESARAARAVLHEVEAGIVAAGRLGTVEALPLLRVLEATPLTNCYWGCHDLLDGVHPELGGSWCMGLREVRFLVNTTLRRLGQRPRGFSAYHFFRECGDDRVSLDVPECIEDRGARLLKLTTQRTARDILDLVGTPDFASRVNAQDVWDYDLDGDETVRIGWDDGSGRVASIERVKPAGWHGDARDAEVLR
jgi:hypothetical protein